MTVQEEIAWQISEALRLKLTAAQKKQLRKQSTVNAEAYQSYLRGRHHWNQWTPDASAARSTNSSAPSTSTRCTPWHMPASATPTVRWRTTAHIDPRTGFGQARAAADRALELDPTLPDAHVTLALGHLFAEWNWAAAEAALQQALALNPEARLRARRLCALPRDRPDAFPSRCSEARTARDLDPLSIFNNIGVAWAHHFAGRHRDAIHEALRIRDLVPGLEEAGNILMAFVRGCSGASRTPRNWPASSAAGVSPSMARGCSTRSVPAALRHIGAAASS